MTNSSHNDNNDTLPSAQVFAADTATTTTTLHVMNNRKRSLSSFSSSSPFLNRDSDTDDDDSIHHGQHEANSDISHISHNAVTRNTSLIDSLENDEDDDNGDDRGQHHGNANKKHRMIISGNGEKSTGVVMTSSSTSWKDFCRQGTRFKALLDDALVKVATATANAGPQQGNQPVSSSLSSAPDSSMTDSSIAITMNKTSHSLLQKLAQEKQTENIHLQNKLEQEQTETATLQALLDDLRSTKEQQTSQITRLTMALQQAAHNATQAR
jgi:hypothetical protein